MRSFHPGAKGVQSMFIIYIISIYYGMSYLFFSLALFIKIKGKDGL